MHLPSTVQRVTDETHVMAEVAAGTVVAVPDALVTGIAEDVNKVQAPL